MGRRWAAAVLSVLARARPLLCRGRGLIHFGSASDAQDKIKPLDGQDGAEAENENLIVFHNPVEEWQRDAGFPKHHPVLQSPTPQNYGEWTLGGTEENYSSQSKSSEHKAHFETGGSQTNSGQIGWGVDLGLTAKIVTAAFKYNEQYTTTDTYTFSASQDFSWDLPASSECYLFWAYGWTEHQGKCDIYQTNGFKGVSDFYGKQYDTMPTNQPGISTHAWHTPLPPQ